MSYTFVARARRSSITARVPQSPGRHRPFYVHEWRQRNYRIVYRRSPSYRGDTYPTEGEPGDQAKGLLADAGKPIRFSISSPST